MRIEVQCAVGDMSRLVSNADEVAMWQFRCSTEMERQCGAGAWWALAHGILGSAPSLPAASNVAVAGLRRIVRHVSLECVPIASRLNGLSFDATTTF